MGDAERPVIYAGGGILKARAAEALRELAELTGIPVVTTLMARGSFPDDHPLCLGMPGMHGNYTAVTSMQKADLLITLGSRFDDRVTGKVSTVRTERQGHPRRHRPRRARQGAPSRRADRRRLPPRDRGAGQGGEGRARQARVADTRNLAPAAAGVAGALPAPVRAARRRSAEAAVLRRDAARQHARRHDRGGGRRPAPDVDEPAVEVQLPEHVGELGWARHDGLRGAGRDRRQGRASPTGWCGRSTATAASR